MLRSAPHERREPINSKWSADVRFRAHSGLKSDITALPKSANTGSLIIYATALIARSTRRKSGGAKRCGIGLNLRRVAATELGLEPCGDREIRAACHQLFGSSSGLFGFAGLLIGDHDIGKTKSGVSGVIRLKRRNRLIGSSRQPVGVSESAQIYGGVVWAQGHGLLAQQNGVFGKSRGRENVTGEFSSVSCPGGQLYRLSGRGDGFIVMPLIQQNYA